LLASAAHNGGVPTTSLSGRAVTPEGVTTEGFERESLSSVTGRAVIVALVILALVLSLALPVREYLQQRDRIADLTTRTVATQSSIDSLTAMRGRWQDPAFIAAQGRSRLHMAFPGEMPFVVIRPDKSAAGAGAADSSPWYSRLWRTVTRSDG